MSDRLKTFWLGVFILVALALLSWLLLFLRPSVGDNKQRLHVRFSNIEKIAIGARVTYGGKAIGEVYEIKTVPNAREEPSDVGGVPYLFELILKIDSHVHVYSCDEILYSTTGLLGEKTIAIIPRVATPTCPNPIRITDEVLYGRSTDQLQRTMDKLLNVAETVDTTMLLVGQFIQENNVEFHQTLSSLRAASVGIAEFTGHAQDLVTKVCSPQGSLGKFMANDHLYLKFMNTMTHFDRLVTTIDRYGLFFQFSSKWLKERRCRECLRQNLCTPCDYYNYFDCEFASIATALDRLNEMEATAECANIPIDTSCLLDKINELREKIENLSRP